MMLLNQIVATKLRELEERKRARPAEELQRLVKEQPPALDFAAALRGARPRLIAEVKHASPSRGIICLDFNPVVIARTYARNGAAAISVLTDSEYFQGSLDHLRDIRDALGSDRPPLLRKDFILDPYQVYESRAYGADALLLIVAILERTQLENLLELSHRLGMACLVEVHNEPEARVAVKVGARVIGINNRDLSTFNVDLTTTQRLRPLVPADRIVVSESGIKDRSDVERLAGGGVDAVLVGEALMSATNIAAKMKELHGQG